jgi:mono/diheme cytochrome c family protein
MTTSRMLSLVVLVACSPANADRDEPQPQPPQRPRFDAPTMVALHMRGRFQEARTIERLLVHGKLDEARTHARALAIAPDVPDASPWSAKAIWVRKLAEDLATSSDVETALRVTAKISGACVECHVATGAALHFTYPAAPADANTVPARMARHQWAVDRLWEGMIGGGDEAWSAGLRVLAATPLPFSVVDADKVALAQQLQRFATTALATRTTDTLDDRTRAYGEMLVTCAACHTTKRTP